MWGKPKKQEWKHPCESRETGSVYKVRDIRSDEVVYVGQTVSSLESRWNSHNRDASKPNPTRFGQWLQENHDYAEMELQEQVPCPELNDREEYWIEQYTDQPLLNTRTKRKRK